MTIPKPFSSDPKYWNSLPDFFRTNKNLGRARWQGFLSTPELFQKNVKDYYRLITGVDDVVGEMVERLKKLGLEKNTIIIYMGDNGMLLGEHGMEGKWYGYEESIRVPLVIYDPLLPDSIHHVKSEQIALNIDIATTILAMAGIEPSPEMQGINLISQLENKIPPERIFFISIIFWVVRSSRKLKAWPEVHSSI